VRPTARLAFFSCVFRGNILGEEGILQADPRANSREWSDSAFAVAPDIKPPRNPRLTDISATARSAPASVCFNNLGVKPLQAAHRRAACSISESKRQTSCDSGFCLRQKSYLMRISKKTHPQEIAGRARRLRNTLADA